MINQLISMGVMLLIGIALGFCIRIDDEYYSMSDSDIDEEIAYLREIKRRNRMWREHNKK